MAALAKTDYLTSLSSRAKLPSSRLSGIGFWDDEEEENVDGGYGGDYIDDGGYAVEEDDGGWWSSGPYGDGGYTDAVDFGEVDDPTVNGGGSSEDPYYALGENTIDEPYVRAYMGKLRAMGYGAPDSGDPNDAAVQEYTGYFQSNWNAGGYKANPPTLNEQGLLDAATMNAIDEASGITANAIVEEQRWEAQNTVLEEPSNPSNPNVKPVVDKPDDEMKKYVIYGGVALAAVIGLALLFSKKKQENPRRRSSRARRRRTRRSRR